MPRPMIRTSYLPLARSAECIFLRRHLFTAVRKMRGDTTRAFLLRAQWHGMSAKERRPYTDAAKMRIPIDCTFEEFSKEMAFASPLQLHRAWSALTGGGKGDVSLPLLEPPPTSRIVKRTSKKTALISKKTKVNH